MKNKKIAIVIPAYKSYFFSETLESIICQTEQNFHLYIGQDGGKDNFHEIIDSYHFHKHITYQYFENNLGQISPAAHWNRCLHMVQDEEWIWLFSDDDLMSPDCTKIFQQIQITEKEPILCYKFDTVKFKEEEPIRKNSFPPLFNTLDFLYYKLNYLAESYAVEYIFHKTLLNTAGWFSEFPLGWCSDDLFWLKISLNTPIRSISNAQVFWRYSDRNISGKKPDGYMCRKKLQACISFIKEIENLNLIIQYGEIKVWIENWLQKQYYYLKASLTNEECVYFENQIKKLLY